MLVCIEECSELQKELCKAYRAEMNGKPVIINNIAEEIADVYIMLAQMVMAFDINDDVARYADEKQKRLAVLLKRKSIFAKGQSDAEAED